MHLAHIVLDNLDDAVDERLFELDIAKTGYNFLFKDHDLFLDAKHPAVQTGALIELAVDFALLAKGRLDLFQQENDPLALVHLVLGGIVFLDGLDHVFELYAPDFEVFAHLDQFLHRHRHFHQGVEHFHLAVLDLFGDDHLALAVKQRNRAHFAQIHAHRVGAARGIVEGILALGQLQIGVRGVVWLGDSRFDLAAVLVGIDEVDVELIEDGNDLFELLGIVDLRRQGFVHLIEGEKTFLLAFDDEAFDLLYLFEITHLPSRKGPVVPREAARLLRFLPAAVPDV